MTSPVRVPARRSEAVRRTGLKIFVRGLRVTGRIGVHAHERGRVQPLVVDLELEVDDRRIEGIADTVDYEKVVALVRTTLAVGHVDLVEEFAERLGRACLDDPRVTAVKIRVDKPEAVDDALGAGCEARFVRD